MFEESREMTQGEESSEPSEHWENVVVQILCQGRGSLSSRALSFYARDYINLSNRHLQTPITLTVQGIYPSPESCM